VVILCNTENIKTTFVMRVVVDHWMCQNRPKFGIPAVILWSG